MHYFFCDCVLDTERYELYRAERQVSLRPKAYQLLLYLLEQRDRVVSKNELFDKLWPDQFTGDATLNTWGAFPFSGSIDG